MGIGEAGGVERLLRRLPGWRQAGPCPTPRMFPDSSPIDGDGAGLSSVHSQEQAHDLLCQFTV